MFSVKDLMSLLKTTDFQFYREASEIHSELRRVNTQMIFFSLLATTLYAIFQELHSISTDPTSQSDFLSLDAFTASVPPSTSSKVSSASAVQNASGSLLPFNTSDHVLQLLDHLCEEDCHVLAITSIVVSVIFVISVFSFVMLCKRKSNYGVKSQYQYGHRNGKTSYINIKWAEEDFYLYCRWRSCRHALFLC